MENHQTDHPIREYDIWLADLPALSGSHVQSGIRPVIVASNDVANKYSPIITVIPLTTNLASVDIPTHTVLHSRFLRCPSKLARRPLTETSNKTEVICASEQRLLINETTDVTIRIPCDGHKYRVRIYNKHLSDPPSITISVLDDTNVTATIEQQATATKPGKTVSVLEDWRREVNRRAASLNNQATGPE